MAQKLSVTIALEGGKEIQRQLKDIGEEGARAFLEIAKAAEQVGGFGKLDPDEVTAKLKEMGVTGVEELNRIGKALDSAINTEKLVTGIKTIETGFAGLRGVVQSFAATIAAAFTPALIRKFAAELTSVADAIVKIDAQAIKLGKSVGELDKLRQGFSNIGIEAKDAVEAAAKFDLSNVERAIKVLRGGARAGFGGFGTAEMDILREAAARFGPVGELARKAMEELGQSVDDLEARFGGPAKTIGEFIERLSKMPDGADRTRLAVSRLGEATGVGLIQALRQGGPVLDQFRQKLAGTLTDDDVRRANELTGAINRLFGAWERLKNLLGTGPLAQDFGDLTAALNAFNNLLDGSSGKWTNWFAVASQALLGAIKWVGDLAVKLNDLATVAGGELWARFATAANSAIKVVGDAIDWLVNKFREAAQWVGKLFGGGGKPGETATAPAMAGGGMVGGRGSGTSDSNLAWVSRGEHVMPASAVRQPGVLQFLEALRRSGGDLRHLLDGMGRFAMGGPVRMPALASGSLGGGGHLGTLTLGLPSGGSVSVRATASVVDALKREAALGQVRSGGRKPSRYT